MGLLSQMVRNQAREMAYLDAFWIFAIMALAALPLVLHHEEIGGQWGPRRPLNRRGLSCR